MQSVGQNENSRREVDRATLTDQQTLDLGNDPMYVRTSLGSSR